MQEIRISLSDQHFKELVSGKIVDYSTHEVYVPHVKISLQDIGFDRMRKIIDNADPKN